VRSWVGTAEEAVGEAAAVQAPLQTPKPTRPTFVATPRLGSSRLVSPLLSLHIVPEIPQFYHCSPRLDFDINFPSQQE